MESKKTQFLLLVLLLSTILLTAKASQEESSSSTHDGSREVNVSGIVSALEDKGYKAMSSTLNNSLTSLLSNQNSTSFTIFCPTDIAFTRMREFQSPLMFLAYHVSPYYIPRDDLELRTETLRMYSGISTLLPGNSLVVTSQVPHLNSNADFEAELNLVKIIDWNIYNDGQVIVHGIQDFFDPAAQAILFPWAEHHESQSQEEDYFSSRHNLLNLLVIFVSCVLVVSGLIFMDISFYQRTLYLGWIQVPLGLKPQIID